MCGAVNLPHATFTAHLMSSLHYMTQRTSVLTFDCYGTLIDWETGISDAIAAAIGQGGIAASRSEIMRLYHEIEPTLQAAEYRAYREILRNALVLVADRLGWRVDPTDAGLLADSVANWRPFPDTNPALDWLRHRGYTLGILSNIDDDLLAMTIEHFTIEFDFVVTAQQVQAYKPAHPHFARARELIGNRRWLHVAQSCFHDVAPAAELGIPVFWINRKTERPLIGARPVAQAETLEGLLAWLGSDE